MQAYFKSTAYTANASDRRAYVQLKLNTLPRAYVFPNESYDAFFAAYASDKKTTVHESVGYFAMLIIDTVSDETIVHKLQTYLSSAIVRVQPHHLHCAYDAQAKRAYFFNMYLSKVDRARVRHDHPELYIAVTGFVPMYNGISKLIIVDNQRATYDIATYAQTNAIVVSSLLSHDRTPVDFDIERSAEWTTRLLMVNTLVRDVTGLVCELHDIPLVYLRDDDDSPVLPSPTSIDDTVAARLTDIIASFTNDTFVYRHRWTRKNVTWLSRKKAGPCAFSTSRTHSRRPAYIRLTEDGSVRFTCNCEAKIRHADKHPPVVICNINDLTTPELTIEQINASLEYAVASPPTVNEPVELVNELVVEPTDASPPATVNAPVEFVEPTDASPPATVNAPVDPVNELVVEPTDASPPATVNELVIEPTDASPVVDEPIDASPSVVVEPISDDDEDDGVNARPLQRRRLMPSSDSDDDLLVAPAQHPPPFGDLQYLFDATDSPPHMPAAAAHDDEDEHDDDGQLMPAEIALKDRLNPRMDPATKDMLIGPYRVTVAGMSVVTKKSVSQAAENDYETILLFAQVFAARNIVIINDKTKTGFIWEDINQLWVPFTEATMRMLLPTIMLPVLRHRMGHARDDGPMEHALVVRNQYNCHHIAYKVPQRNAKKKAKGDDQYGKLVNNISRISKMSAITTGLVGFVHNPSFLSTVNKNEFFLPIQHGKAVDLRNGQIVSRNRFALAFTHELPYKYTPMSSFPNVDKFVMSICAGDVALFEYIHLICGYFLTGNVEGRSLFIAYGVGRNGKSTLVNTISKVMGQFAGTISESIFTDSARSASRGAASPDMAVFETARLVAVTEIDRTSKLRSSIVKTIIGDDPLPYRNLFEATRVIRTQARVLLAVNDLPNMDFDLAMRHRLKVIPFSACFPQTPENQRYVNIELRRREFLEEFLSWAVVGAKKFYDNGRQLPLPPVCVAAMDEYFRSVDRVRRFIDEVCEVASGACELPSVLFAAFRDWLKACGEQGTGEASVTHFVNDLARNCFKLGKPPANAPPHIGGHECIGGIRLKTAATFSTRTGDARAAMVDMMP